MYFYGVKYKKKITQYSPLFDKVKDAESWYKRKGIKLIEMFGRTLILTEKK